MSSRVLISAALATTIALGSLPSFAQGPDQRGRVIIIQPQHDNRYQERERREDRHDNRRDRRRQERTEEHRFYYGARGPEFARGHMIPRDLRSHQYVVNNYRLHRLPPPPRGHHWVQVGADYVLVAIATGIIVSILLNH